MSYFRYIQKCSSLFCVAEAQSVWDLDRVDLERCASGRRGVTTPSLPCPGTLEQGTKPLSAQDACLVQPLLCHLYYQNNYQISVRVRPACHLCSVVRVCVFPPPCLCLCTQNSPSPRGTHLSPCRPPLLGLTMTSRGWEPGRGLIWRRAINTAQTRMGQDWWGRQRDVGGRHTCRAWPSPRVNLKVWLASSGLVLGGDSPSPRFSIDWRSYKHKRCLHFLLAMTRHPKAKRSVLINTFLLKRWIKSVLNAADSSVLKTCYCRSTSFSFPSVFSVQNISNSNSKVPKVTVT